MEAPSLPFWQNGLPSVFGAMMRGGLSSVPMSARIKLILGALARPACRLVEA